MLIKSKELKGYKLGATDGDIGKVMEFYFDDRHWTIRYLVADTGGWLNGRQVLISPYGLESIDIKNRVVQMNLTRKQIESSPSLESDQPVSQQFEESYYGYYGWPAYWGGHYAWGITPYIDRNEVDHSFAEERKRHWDPSLRSTTAVAGYHIQACDGELGHVKDFIIDDQTWEIRYLVVDTGNWLGGKQVLISPYWIESISWRRSWVFTSLSQQEVRTAPEYSEQSLLDRTYEASLYDHYGRDKYWDRDVDLNRLSSTQNKLNRIEHQRRT
jgi:uncharacterized protein YrrD